MFEDFRQRIKSSLYIGWAALVGTMITVYLFDIPLEYRFLPLLASSLFLGLPHGAIDYLLYPKTQDADISLRSSTVFGLIYLILGSAYLALWLVNAVEAFILFILITIFHWGFGDIQPLRDLIGVDYIDSVQKYSTVLIRGGAPMILTLVAFPETYRSIMSLLVNFFPARTLSLVDFIFAAKSRILLLILYSLLAFFVLLRGYINTEDFDAWKIDLFETLLLTFFFLTVPPILAIGIYFCFWHSLRHINRYMMLEQADEQNPNTNTYESIKKFVLQATPITLLSILLLSLLHLMLGSSGNTLSYYTGIYLVLISLLTPPHMVIVGLLDRKQGII